jgi:hypothetical protein
MPFLSWVGERTAVMRVVDILPGAHEFVSPERWTCTWLGECQSALAVKRHVPDLSSAQCQINTCVIAAPRPRLYARAEIALVVVYPNILAASASHEWSGVRIRTHLARRLVRALRDLV